MGFNKDQLLWWDLCLHSYWSSMLNNGSHKTNIQKIQIQNQSFKIQYLNKHCYFLFIIFLGPLCALRKRKLAQIPTQNNFTLTYIQFLLLFFLYENKIIGLYIFKKGCEKQAKKYPSVSKSVVQNMLTYLQPITVVDFMSITDIS